MQTILQINTSLPGPDGHSSRLARRFVQAWQRRNRGGRLVLRDLGADPVPHLNAERFQAFLTPKAQRSAQQQAVAAYSEALIDELRSADAVVLGLPLYNFGVPSPLKAYFDHVARAGLSFRYTEQGPIGLLPDRPVHVLATRGGVHRDTPQDTQSAYVRDFFRFLGIRDLRFIYAEGLSLGPARQEASLAEAEAQIDRAAA